MRTGFVVLGPDLESGECAQGEAVRPTLALVLPHDPEGERMRRITLAIVTVVAALGIGVGGASAEPSPCGAVHGAFANDNGNFGFLGQEWQGAPNYHGGVVGQEPGATGYNNSHYELPEVGAASLAGRRRPPGDELSWFGVGRFLRQRLTTTCGYSTSRRRGRGLRRPFNRLWVGEQARSRGVSALTVQLRRGRNEDCARSAQARSQQVRIPARNRICRPCDARPVGDSSRLRAACYDASREWPDRLPHHARRNTGDLRHESGRERG